MHGLSAAEGSGERPPEEVTASNGALAGAESPAPAPEPHGPPIVEAEALVKRFGGSLVLDGLALRMLPGATLLVRGRSGSGKSTLLHLLAGIEAPTSGSVRLLGRDLAPLTPAERASLRLRHVGLVFQHFNLIPDLTAEENVRLPMVMVRRRNARSRAQELLAQVGLAGKARAFPSSLSGGEMQRVAIARALSNEPALILADEPTANLDEPNGLAVLEMLVNIAGGGRAVVVASHDPLAVRLFPDRVRLDAGRFVPAAEEPMQG